MTFSTSRFGIYELCRRELTNPGENLRFFEKVWIAGIGGAAGGIIGAPADRVNVRMQSDVKLPHEERFKYVHSVYSTLSKNAQSAAIAVQI